MIDDNKELKLAVLIDAENVPYHNVKSMLEEIAKYGALLPSGFTVTGPVPRPRDGKVSSWKTQSLLSSSTVIPQARIRQTLP